MSDGRKNQRRLRPVTGPPAAPPERTLLGDESLTERQRRIADVLARPVVPFALRERVLGEVRRQQRIQRLRRWTWAAVAAASFALATLGGWRAWLAQQRLALDVPTPKIAAEVGVNNDLSAIQFNGGDEQALTIYTNTGTPSTLSAALQAEAETRRIRFTLQTALPETPPALPLSRVDPAPPAEAKGLAVALGLPIVAGGDETGNPPGARLASVLALAEPAMTAVSGAGGDFGTGGGGRDPSGEVAVPRPESDTAPLPVFDAVAVSASGLVTVQLVNEPRPIDALPRSAAWTALRTMAAEAPPPGSGGNMLAAQPLADEAAAPEAEVLARLTELRGLDLPAPRIRIERRTDALIVWATPTYGGLPLLDPDRSAVAVFRDGALVGLYLPAPVSLGEVGSVPVTPAEEASQRLAERSYRVDAGQTEAVIDGFELGYHVEASLDGSGLYLVPAYEITGRLADGLRFRTLVLATPEFR